MITINHTETETETTGADEIESGKLFRDSDGDLYLRLGVGCIMFTDGGESILVPENFSEDDLTDYASHPYLENCTEVKGKISIAIDLEEEL